MNLEMFRCKFVAKVRRDRAEYIMFTVSSFAAEMMTKRNLNKVMVQHENVVGTSTN